MSEETIVEETVVEEQETIVITDPDADRYHTFGYISWWKQEVVRDATVMVIGAGALGNEVLKNLALMGVGNLLIADFDTIEDSNLSRSVLFRQSDRGRRKVDAAAEAVKELNPDVKVKTFHGDINHEVGLGTFRNVDAVVGCLDNREARLSIDRFCASVGKPWVDGAIQELMGIVRVFWSGRGATYEMTLSDRDYQIIGLRYSCPVLARQNILQGKVPTTPTSASIVAAFQTQETLKLIHGMEVEPGVGMMINGLTNDVYKTEYPLVNDRFIPALENVIETPLSQESTLADMLAVAAEHLGEGATITFAHEVVVSMFDPITEETEAVFKRMASLTEDVLATSVEGTKKEMTLTHSLSGDEDFLDRTLAEFDLVPLTIVQARNGDEVAYLEMTGDKESFLAFA